MSITSSESKITKWRKLKAGDVDRIRQRYAEGEKARVLAEAFGISTKYVQELVVSRKPRRKS
jgi:hypothetical protein